MTETKNTSFLGDFREIYSVPVHKLDVLVKKYITTALRIFNFLLDWS
jgi:hypothetical protein